MINQMKIRVVNWSSAKQFCAQQGNDLKVNQQKLPIIGMSTIFNHIEEMVSEGLVWGNHCE